MMTTNSSIEKLNPKLDMSPAPLKSSGCFRWTVDTFYRALAGGVFSSFDRWELINGQLWNRVPMNPPHAALVGILGRMFRALFEPHYLVMEEKPIHLRSDGEPQPDICIVANTNVDFGRHPEAEEVRLIIEVTDTIKVRDLEEKWLLYAQAGIADYWVSLINERQVIIFRNPTELGYTDKVTLTESDTIAPLFAPEIIISVANLLPPKTENTVKEDSTESNG